mmetsp:Transcript_12394/g.29147  ORF Transcript_12394/g.29147 Transcript_12394/m.29147 type:complete len:233 (+) Transcript_12394:5194-5892(+)
MSRAAWISLRAASTRDLRPTWTSVGSLARTSWPSANKMNVFRSDACRPTACSSKSALTCDVGWSSTRTALFRAGRAIRACNSSGLRLSWPHMSKGSKPSLFLITALKRRFVMREAKKHTSLVSSSSSGSTLELSNLAAAAPAPWAPRPFLGAAAPPRPLPPDPGLLLLLGPAEPGRLLEADPGLADPGLDPDGAFGTFKLMLSRPWEATGDGGGISSRTLRREPGMSGGAMV